MASTPTLMLSTALLDSVTCLKRCYNAAQNNPANSDVYRSISALRNAELLENFSRRRSLSVQSEITRDHLDFHALAREQLALQLLLQVYSPLLFVFHPPPHPPPLPSSLPAVVSASLRLFCTVHLCHGPSSMSAKHEHPCGRRLLQSTELAQTASAFARMG